MITTSATDRRWGLRTPGPWPPAAAIENKAVRHFGF